MKNALLLSLVLWVVDVAAETTITFGRNTRSFQIEFVEIGDPGNFADDVVRNTGPDRVETTRQHNEVMPVGNVDYSFHMSKHEVSIGEFELAIEDGVPDLWLNTELIRERISEPTPDMPAMRVTWIQAARFANWLNEIEGYPAAYKFVPFENPPPEGEFFGWSPWEIGDAGFDPENPLRNSQAKFVIPTAHEWHKSAYYDPESKSCLAFSTGESEPEMTLSGTDPGTAVVGFEFIDGPADATDAGGLSPYGVMAMTGNVVEWEEGAYDIDNYNVAGEALNSYRVSRGGAWTGRLILHRLVQGLGVNATLQT